MLTQANDTRLSDYTTKVFGFATFGRVYGMIICLSGLVNFGQSGLDALTHGPLNGDPTLVNIFMGVTGTVLAIALTSFVYIKSRNYNLETHEGAGVDERMSLIREDAGEYGTMG
jgi:hypothetical protein